MAGVYRSNSHGSTIMDIMPEDWYGAIAVFKTEARDIVGKFIKKGWPVELSKLPTADGERERRLLVFPSDIDPAVDLKEFRYDVFEFISDSDAKPN